MSFLTTWHLLHVQNWKEWDIEEFIKWLLQNWGTGFKSIGSDLFHEDSRVGGQELVRVFSTAAQIDGYRCISGTPAISSPKWTTPLVKL